MNGDLTNTRILTLALDALKSEREKIDAEILSVQQRLDGAPRRVRAVKASGSHISATGRKSISEAMKKHWIERRRRMAKQHEKPSRKGKS